MIQPAAPSLLVASPIRSSSPAAAGGGAVFVLPDKADADVIALAGSATGGGEERHDDAASGNPLPTGAAPALDPWRGETLTPIASPSPEADPTAGSASPPTEPRSPKFALPIAPLPSSRRTMAAPGVDGPVEQDATPDRGDEPASLNRVDATLAAPPRPDAVVLATPTIAPAVDTPPTMPLAAPAEAAEPRAASPSPTIAAAPVADRSPPLPAERRPAEPRLAGSPAPPLADIAVPTTATGPSIVPASALATSSLTPLDRHVGARAGSAMPIVADGTTPVIAPNDALDTPPTPIRRARADTLVEPVARAVAASPRSVEDEPATTSSPAPSSPANAGEAPVRDVAVPLPSASSVIVTQPAATTSGSPVRPIGGASSVLAPISTLAPDRRPSPPSNVARPAPVIAQAPFPTHWQWAPRAMTAPDATAASVGAAIPLAPPVPSPPLPLPSGTLDRPVAPTLPSTPSPAAATIVPAPPAEKRPDATTIGPLATSAAPFAPPVTSAPAAIVFGAARFAAQVADDRDEPAAPLGLAPLAGPQTIERAVAGVAATAQAPLDLRQEHWPHAMIERIEMIRDAADAVDTRIRLVPDALGAIDVEVKRDGDTLNVRFHAEQAQTRTLLADAAPRLAEAAEARGLRLGQSTVGADTGSAGQGQQRQPLPAAPPRAPRSPAADAQAGDDDTRLA